MSAPGSTNHGVAGEIRDQPIATVLGDVLVSELGVVLHHEHLWTRNEGVYAQFPHLYDRTRIADVVVDRVQHAKARGLGTLCDATVMGLGRDTAFQREVAARTGVHVIASTGLYTFDALPPYFAGRSIEVLAECFVRDLVIGVQGTTSRAAFLKCATDAPGVTEGVEKVLRAVSAAHRETGAPILTHTSAAHRRGLDQLAIFEAEGVDLQAVVIGHCGDTDDLEYLTRLLDRGARIGLDRFGQDDRISADARRKVVVDLCAAGYADQLVLSQDHSIVRDVFYDNHVLDSRRNWHTSFLLESVLGDLEADGLDRATVHAMVSGNVYRWLARPLRDNSSATPATMRENR